MQELRKDDLETIVYGATFLASGGGGSFASGWNLVKHFPDHGRVQAVSVEEAGADENALSAVVAYIGAPDAIAGLGKPTGAINALKKLNQLYNNRIHYIVPVEIGGLSTIVACLTAAELEMAVVDGDGAGRAVPTLTMTTFAGAGYSGNPSVLDNSDGEGLLVEVEAISDVEGLVRPILGAPAYNEKAGLAMWPMTAQELIQGVPIRDTLTLSWKLGHALRHSEQKIETLLRTLQGEGREPYRLMQGRVHLLSEQTRGGFDFGKVVFRDQDGAPKGYIYNQNENLVAWSPQQARPLAIGPDSICYVTLSGLPFSNADIQGKVDGQPIEGQESLLVGVTARDELRRNPEIRGAFKRTLVNQGYPGPLVPLNELQ